MEGCSEKALEASEGYLCDGVCKKHLEEDKYIITKCCQARICFDCFETLFSHKHSSGTTLTLSKSPLSENVNFKL